MIVTGDNVSGSACATAEQLRRAIGNVAAAMEEAGVAWAVTLGNHDQEHFEKTGITREQAMELYAAYPHNRNGGRERGLTGAGNQLLTVWDEAGAQPAFHLWLLDSGAYTDNKDDHYDWIHADQVAWYFSTSRQLEARYSRKVPGLMFFHIPVPEFREMALGGKMIGERHEPESPSAINGGLFAAALERGDVKGIFCGHDHVNNYVGKYRGVWLGYNGVVGFAGYPHTPPEDATNGRARSGRVFRLTPAAEAPFQTWMRFADGTVNWEAASPAYQQDQLR